MIDAPIRTGVEVLRADARAGAPGFTVETSAGRLIAQRLVVATGAFQTPRCALPPATGFFTPFLGLQKPGAIAGGRGGGGRRRVLRGADRR